MGLQQLMDIKFGQKEIELGGEKYLVKELSAGDFGKYQSSLIKMVNNQPVYKTENAAKNLVLYSLHNLDGTRVFEDKDSALIENLPKSVVVKIFEIASKLNGMGENAEKN